MSEKKMDGGPAFPGITGPRSIEDVRAVRDELGMGLADARKLLSHNPGMSLRDWFAGRAMSAILGLGTDYDHSAAYKAGLTTGQSTAKDAYTLADAMIAAREQPTPGASA